MLTFEEARQAWTDATGYPTEPRGLVGPDRYLVVPLSPPWERVYNDTVQTVTFDGDVEAVRFDREALASWPAVVG